MPLQIKPHVITARSVTQATGIDSVLGNPARGSEGFAISCLCAQLKPIESFQRFGVALVDAWVVYLETADAVGMAPQTEIAFNAKTYYVRGDVEIHQNGDAADCAVVYMTRLQYPEGS